MHHQALRILGLNPSCFVQQASCTQLISVAVLLLWGLSYFCDGVDGCFVEYNWVLINTASVCLSVEDLWCLCGGASENGKVKRERKTKSSDSKERRGEEEGKKVNLSGVTGTFHNAGRSMLRAVVDTSVVQVRWNLASHAGCVASCLSWQVTTIRNAKISFCWELYFQNRISILLYFLWEYKIVWSHNRVFVSDF